MEILELFFSKEGLAILFAFLILGGIYAVGYYHGSEEPQVVTKTVEVCTCPEERTRIERGTDAVIRFLGEKK